MKLAILGGGKGAEPHFKAVQSVDAIEWVGVAEINPERRSEIEAAYNVRTFGDYRELLEVAKPDGVLVALPHNLHVEAAITCIQAGAHVLVEKPLAITLEGCNAIIEAAAKAGKTLMVGHTHHYIPTVMEARELVRSGAVGDVLMATDAIYGNYFTPVRPRWFFDAKLAGGGSWIANGVHLVDRTCWILDELPNQVFARMTYHPEMPEIETSVTATLAFPSGRAATILMSMMENERKEEGEILGARGTIRYSAFGGITTSDGKETNPVTPRHKHNPRAAQLQEFEEAVRVGRQPAVTGEWGREIVRAVLAAYESHRVGGPVSLDWV